MGSDEKGRAVSGGLLESGFHQKHVAPGVRALFVDDAKFAVQLREADLLFKQCRVWRQEFYAGWSQHAEKISSGRYCVRLLPCSLRFNVNRGDARVGEHGDVGQPHGLCIRKNSI